MQDDGVPLLPHGDIVATAEDAAGLERPPLIVLERVAEFLDRHRIGSGPVDARRIGDGGGSNCTYVLERRDARVVLRRPPRPPLPPSAHDMVREARLALALARAGVRVPTVLAVCEDAAVLGVPFYVMEFLEGVVLTRRLPVALADDASARRRVGEALVEALVEIHGIDVSQHGLDEFSRPGSYLERQVRRFSQLWEVNATREVGAVAEVGRLLLASLPATGKPTVVHGDYRLGNVMLDCNDPTRVVAILDWEMGAIGDPRADLGYLVATYSEPGGAPNALDISPVTATPGFPSRVELVEFYARRTGGTVESLEWFEALALWKAAVFCEAIYGRWLRGDLSAGCSRAATFETIVPRLAEAAGEVLSGATPRS